MSRWIFALCLALSVNLQAETKILAFAGSTQKNSINKKLVADAVRGMKGKVTLVDLKDYPMPFYDADLETAEGMPEKARAFRKLMLESDVIVIASPEYNGSLSAVLKNTIDWASRTEKGEGSREAFKDKKFIIMSASPGPTGGARGLVHLRTILENLGGKVEPQQVVVPDAYNAFQDDGKLKNQKALDFLLATTW